MRQKIFIVLFLCCACVSFAAAQSSGSGSDHWSGFYLGGNLTIPSDKAEAEASLRINQVSNLFVAGTGIIVVPSTVRTLDASRRKTNWSGGGQAGYQWQIGGFVFGPEADFNPFRRTISVTQSYQLPPTLLTQTTTAEARRDVRIRGEFSIRARAGGAIGKTLIYGTIGYGQAGVEVSSIDTFTNPGGATLTAPPVTLGPSGPVVTTAEEKQNMGGWTGGFGVERKLSKNFSIGFEYRHTDYRSKTFALSSQTTINTGPEAKGTNGIAGLSGGVETEPTRIALKSDSFAVRVNFHF